MKKIYVFSLLTMICLFVLGLLCIGFPRKMGNSYSSVRIFNHHASREFYDFYAPDYYLHPAKPKQKLSDINRVDIWYHGSVDDYYSIVFKEALSQDKYLEIVYSVEKFSEDEFLNIKEQYMLIEDDYHIYLDVDESHVYAVYNHDNQEIVRIQMSNWQYEAYSLEKMKSIVYNIMKDSIQLNIENRRKV